jgi:hypothetical protein
MFTLVQIDAVLGILQAASLHAIMPKGLDGDELAIVWPSQLLFETKAADARRKGELHGPQRTSTTCIT